jgi:hypothetical protein
LEVNQSSQSIANNTSVVSYALYAERFSGTGTWSLDVKGSSSVTIQGSAIGGPAFNYDFRNSSTTPKLIMSGSTTVGHNSDGTLTISFSGFANSASTLGSATTNTGYLTLTTIPRTSNVSLSSGTFEAGSAVTINTNRASSTFTHTATFGFGGASGTIATGIANSVSWTPPLDLLQQISQSTSGVGTITLQTFSGGTFIGSSAVNFTLTAGGGIVPSFSAVTATENVTLVSTEVGAFVQTLTRLNVAIVGAAGVQGSTISAATITVAGQVISALSGLTEPIGTSGTVSVVGTITDSRGRTATRTINITVLPYIPPTVNPALTFARRSNTAGVLDDNGTSIRVDINAVVQSLIVSTQRNALTYRVSTRLRGATVFTIQTTVTPGGIAFNNFVVVNTFAVSSSFEVLVEAFDKFNSGALQFTVATSSVFMHWGVGLGVGKFYEPNRGSIDAAGPIFQNNGQAVSSVGHQHDATAIVSGILPSDRLRPALRIQAQQVFGNWDSHTETGFYDGSGLANRPPGSDWVWVTVNRHSNGDGWVVQQATEFFGSNKTWIRTRFGGTWQPWRELARRGVDGVPFAQAAGAVGAGGYAGGISPIFWSGGVTITFPAGRFTVAPIVTVGPMPNPGAVSAGTSVENVTASSFSSRFQLVGSTRHDISTIHYHAVQMTATSGAG